MVYHGIILVDVMFKMRFRPMGAYRIANMLREAGYNILVIDMYSTMSITDLKDTLSKVISAETLFFSYSSTMFGAVKEYSEGSMASDQASEPGIPTSREYFIETNEYVKQLNPNIKIIYGGACTINMKDILNSENRNLNIDYFVEGYAEGMVVDVVNNIRDNLPQRVGNIIKNTECINYDPQGKLFDFRNHSHVWHESDLIMTDEVLPIEVARGCVFKCKFCSFPLIGKRKDDLSYLRTEEKLVEEIVSNYEKYKTTKYVIVDDTFNERNDKLEMLLRARDAAKIDLQFSSYIRLDLVAAWPEQLAMLSDLNVSVQYFGIESLTEAAAKAISKPGNPDRMIETIHKMHDAFNGKVNMQAGQIIGLPYETRDTLEVSINRMIDSPLSSVLFLPLWLGNSAYGESELLRNPEKYGYEHLGGGLWKNEHWDSNICGALSVEYTNKYVESGRTKIGFAEMHGMLNLGYEFDDLIKIPVKEYLYGSLCDETTRRHYEHRNQYLNSLTEYVNR